MPKRKLTKKQEPTLASWCVGILYETRRHAMKLAVYYRCSTDKQSLEHQRQSVRQWIKSQGYKPRMLQEFEDKAVSGSKSESERPGLAALLSTIAQGIVDRVLIFEGSRISRDMIAFLQFMETCQKQGVTVEVVGKGVQSFETAQNKLSAAIQGFVAQAEKESISARISSGMKAAMADPAKQIGARPGERRKLGYRKRYSEALVDEIRYFTERGLSCAAIAKAIGAKYTDKPLSHGTVNNIQRRYGISKAS